jgi:hypothetical protein
VRYKLQIVRLAEHEIIRIYRTPLHANSKHQNHQLIDNRFAIDLALVEAMYCLLEFVRSEHPGTFMLSDSRMNLHWRELSS